jgi:hypothetical protein
LQAQPYPVAPENHLIEHRLLPKENCAIGIALLREVATSSQNPN